MKKLGLILMFCARLAQAQLTAVPNSDFPTFRTNLNNSLSTGVNRNLNYSNPSFIATLDWSKIINTPSLGLGTVTSVSITGTANQITATGTCTGTITVSCTLSLPSVLTLPGTINKITLTAPATGATLTIIDGKTLRANNTVTFTGTDGSTITYGAGGTVSYIGVSETWTGDKTLTGVFNAAGSSHTLPVKVGSGVPAISCTLGELFFSTTVSAGANLYFCTTTNVWNQMSAGGGGGGSVFTGSTATATTGITGTAAAPILALTDQSLKSPVRFEIALTASTPVTSVTVNNKTAGAKFSVAWTQPSSNMTTVTYGAGFSNTCIVDPAASITTTQFFEIGSDGSTINGTGCGTNHTGIESGPETSAPGTTAAGVWTRWVDSTTHVPSSKTNSNPTVFQMTPVPANTQICIGNAGGTACANQTVTGDVTLSNTGVTTIGAAKVAPSMMKASTWDTQTDGATITWAIGSVLNAQGTVTLGGNRTLAITNPVIGGFYTLKIIQDGTGTRTLALGSGCTWKVSGGGSGAITPSTAAGSIDILSFTYDGTNCYANFNKNFN